MKQTPMELFGKLVISIVILIGGTILKGFVISKLWGWIIVPIFAITPINVIEGIGFGLIVTFLTQKIDLDKEKKIEEWGKSVLQAFAIMIAYLFILGFGWLLTLWIN